MVTNWISSLFPLLSSSVTAIPFRRANGAYDPPFPYGELEKHINQISSKEEKLPRTNPRN